MKRTRDHSIEGAVYLLISALALPLIRLGVTPAKVSLIARAAFVNAGVRYARKTSSGRPHLARIAALTGLARSEVKRIVSTNYSIADVGLDTAPRANRVLNAWRRLKPYSYRGRPLQLRIAGSAPSFAALCRQHSGDIPHRVILDELATNGLVILNNQKTHVRVSRRKTSKVDHSDLEALRFVASLLQGSLLEDAAIVRRRQRVRTSSAVVRATKQKD